MTLQLFPTTALREWDGRTQSVYRLATGWTVRGSNVGGGETFRTCADRLWGPPSFLYNWYRLSFPGVKRSGRGVNHPSPSSAKMNERLQLHLYSPSGPSRSVLGWNLLLPLTRKKKGFKFIVPVNAFTTVRCTDSGGMWRNKGLYSTVAQW